jgi:serine/threonine-protein kinase
VRPFGRYELRAKIAQGGMAEVFLAIQRGAHGFEKPVAIKQLLPEIAEEPGLVEMFINEARLLAKLSHPNICQVFDFGEEQGRTFMAMEYLSGQTLSRLWRKGSKDGRPLSPELGAYVVARAADGLAHAHQASDLDGKSLGIIHRDVSPQNIIVTYDGLVKLVDFGIARTATRARRTATGLVRGKVPYLSPEQVRGEPLDPRSDVFSLGIVLYEVLSGRYAFPHDDDQTAMQKIAVGAVEPLNGVTAPLREVAEAALQVDPARRTATARELALQLDRALEHLEPRPEQTALAREMQALFVEERAGERARLQAAQAGNLDAFLFEAREVTTEPAEEPRHTREARAPEPGRRPSVSRRIALASGLMGVAAIGILAGGRFLHGPPAPEAAPVAVAAPTPPPPAPPPVAGAPPTPPILTAAPVPEAPPASPSRAAPPRGHARKATATLEKGEKSDKVEKPVGRLTLDSTPWTDVYLGERKLGTTPLVEIEVPAGSYWLRMVNTAAKVDRRVTVNVHPNQLLELPRQSF